MPPVLRQVTATAVHRAEARRIGAIGIVFGVALDRVDVRAAGRLRLRHPSPARPAGAGRTAPTMVGHATPRWPLKGSEMMAPGEWTCRELVIEATDAAAVLMADERIAAGLGRAERAGRDDRRRAERPPRARRWIGPGLPRSHRPPRRCPSGELLTPVTYFHAAIDSPIHERIKEVSASESLVGPAEMATRCAEVADGDAHPLRRRAARSVARCARRPDADARRLLPHPADRGAHPPRRPRRQRRPAATGHRPRRSGDRHRHPRRHQSPARTATGR